MMAFRAWPFLGPDDDAILEIWEILQGCVNGRDKTYNHGGNGEHENMDKDCWEKILILCFPFWNSRGMKF